MSNSDLIRKYFSAYEDKDRKAVESLLSHDFVFTSPYDYRIDRETYFKRCWPYSEQSPTYEIEKMLERDNEARDAFLELYPYSALYGFGYCQNLVCPPEGAKVAPSLGARLFRWPTLRRTMTTIVQVEFRC